MSSEMIAMIEYLGQEKEIDKETLFTLVEDALVSVYRKELPESSDLKVNIHRKNGAVVISVNATVVDRVVNRNLEVALETVRKTQPDADLGDVVRWIIPQDSFSRIAAQNTKQAILQRMRQYEKDRVVDEYSDQIGELVSGRVRGFEKGELLIDFGRAEGGMDGKNRIKSEDYQPGDHVTAILLGVDPKKAGPALIVSRTHPDFIRKLFEREVAEIGEGVVEIKGIARDAGFRTKIAVYSRDPRVDPVGACVGLRGTRVKSIVRDLNREKLDIIQWKDDIHECVKEAFKPTPIEKVEIDPDGGRLLRVYVTAENYSSILGKEGKNVRLTEALLDWDIEVERYTFNPEKSLEEHLAEVVETFKKIPGVDSSVASGLIEKGFTSLEGLKDANPVDLADIPGLDESKAASIVAYAKSKLHA